MTSSRNNSRRLPPTPALNAAIVALSNLRSSYRRLFNDGKKPKRWDRCVHMHGAAVRALEDPDLEKVVNPRIASLHAKANGGPGKGFDVLTDCYQGMWRREQLERELGRGAGFTHTELLAFVAAAKGCLKRAAKHREDLPHVVDTAGLIAHLNDIHSLAEEVILQPDRKIKRGQRPHAEKQILFRLYMVVAVVANSDFGDIFNYSYASGLGAAGHKPRLPKRLKGKVRYLPQGIPTPSPAPATET